MATKTRAPRHTWSTGFKKRVVAEASQPGVSAAQIARQYDLNANLLFNWKKKFGASSPMLPVEIELPNGIKVRCSAQVDPIFVGKIVTAVRSKP